jgi:hypothetical protein
MASRPGLRGRAVFDGEWRRARGRHQCCGPGGPGVLELGRRAGRGIAVPHVGVAGLRTPLEDDDCGDSQQYDQHQQRRHPTPRGHSAVVFGMGGAQRFLPRVSGGVGIHLLTSVRRSRRTLRSGERNIYGVPPATWARRSCTRPAPTDHGGTLTQGWWRWCVALDRTRADSGLRPVHHE